MPKSTAAAPWWERLLDRHFFTVFIRLPLMIIATLALLFVVLGMIPKLYKRAQIQGWITGATITEEIITHKASQKWQELDRNDLRISRGTNYLVSWSDQPPLEGGANRLSLQREAWDKLRIGDTLEVIRIGQDERAYSRNSVFASTGNMVLDLVFTLAALGIFALCLFFVVKSYEKP